MNAERYRKAGELYHAALELPPERRAEFLERACAGDLDLLADVESLLAAHADAGDFIAAPPPHVGTLLESVVLRSGEVPAWPADEPPEDLSDSLLTPGQRLGRYEVIDFLSSGGMGSVYRALDPTLGREVAIKALTPTFRGDSASLRRFEREARVLATLSHPNIAAIYAFEHLDGSPYLILERVDGETLADRLRRGALPIDAAIGIAVQIVAGLEEAHGKGLVHRDLKPSNVMITPDGRVKLVDFGLAKGSGSRPALDSSTQPITSPGIVLGTARYMSPEQVRGEAVDARSDVWAFGCVLYEMLTARPIFGGRSVSEVVAAVLRDDPDWRALPADTPRGVRRLLRRCLRRDPQMRLHHIGDARLDLVEEEEGESTTGVVVAASRPGRRSRTGWVIAAASAAVIGVVAFLRSPAPVSTRQTMRLSVELPNRLTLASDYSPPFAVAPGGGRAVFEAIEGGTQRLYVRDLADPAVRVIEGTEGARQPFFSPDGEWVGFFANRKLSKVPIGGGPVLHLSDTGSNPRGAAWAPDGTIVFAAPQNTGLARIPDAGGTPVPLTTLDTSRSESSHRWPEVLPGGQWVLFTVGLEEASYDEGRIEAVSLRTGERRLLVDRAGFARYAGDGRLLFVRAGRLHAVRFDPERIAVLGTPDVVLDPVRYDFRNGGAHLAASASGAVLYGPGEVVSSDYFLAWVDRDGRLTRATDTPRPFRNVKASPDGRRIATVIGTSTSSDLWLVDQNGTLSQLTFGLAPHRPTWTPDGKRITVAAQQDGTWRLLTLAADGPAASTVLFEGPERVYPNAWSADGRYLVFQEQGPRAGWELRILAVDASGRPVGSPQPFASTPFDETSAALSPDGRWISYESNELDGVFQIYVRSFPDGGHKVRVSASGARWPAWDSRGTLHYWQTTDDTLQAVHTQQKGGQLVIGAPQPVWRRAAAAAALGRIVNPLSGARYDLGAGGARFLVLETVSEGSGAGLSHPILVLGGSMQPR